MKMLTIIVRAEKLGSVVSAIRSAGIQGMTVSDVRGHGIQKGETHQYRGMEYHMDFILKSKVEIVVDDEQVEPIIEKISEIASTGKPGDGKIFITEVMDAIRIRTGERGSSAL